jgi:ribosomal protein S27AE
MGAGVLICGACRSRWYSAAADQMVGRGATCPACGSGPLTLAEEREGENGSGDEEGEEAQI